MIELDNERSHILISRTDKTKDVALTLPMIEALRKKYPKATISLLIQRDAYSFAKLYPEIDKIFIFEPKKKHRGFWGFFRLARDFGNENIDVVISVYPRFVLALFFLYLLIPHRIGTSRRLYSLLYNFRINLSRKKGGSHETTYNLRLLLPLGIDATAKDMLYPQYLPSKAILEKVHIFLKENAITDYIVIQPILVGTGPSWPLSYMQDLIYLIIHRLGLAVVLIGHEEDSEAIYDMQKKINQVLNKKQLLHIYISDDIQQRAALFQKARMFFGNYDGCHYISVAMGILSLVLFPLSPGMAPSRYAPYGPGHFVAMRPRLTKCKKCIQSKCEYKNCLSYILPEIIFEEMKNLLQETSS